MRTVTKNNYIKGKNGTSKALAHTRYIQYRDGDDREKGPRSFFDKERDQVTGYEVRQQIEEWNGRGVVMHRIVLSPGVNGIDLKEYTREVMDDLSERKGQQLDWKAVIHQNTDHHHIHICLMGKDLEGRDVRLNRGDLREMRDASDRVLERDYYYERFLDRDLHVLTSRDEYKREGDDFFKSLFYSPERQAELERKQEERAESTKNWDKEKAIEKLPAEEKIEAAGTTWTKFNTRDELLALDGYLKSDNTNRIDKEEYSMMWTWIGVKGAAGDDFYEREARGTKDFRDYDEFKHFEDDLRKALRGEEGDLPRRVMGEQRILEKSGRLSDYHFVYTKNMEKERIEEIGRSDPEKIDWAEREVQELNRHDDGQWNGRKFDLDRFLYGCQPAWDLDRGYDGKRNEPTRDAPDTQATDPTNQTDPNSDPTKTDDSSSDPDAIRTDLLGGQAQTPEEEHDREPDRDFHGNEQ